ncbi:MAG: S9 family peptidase [Candidatus Eisenbacteria bacterium]|uniref:Acyl-peptide hydrolase n=1 Tax=Eiseniibacteriota bacterium TaxID=2212470 RepID=A0A538SGS4_UNCEI|nr:MAG: S9 family peptidase [Candidatus Eisenbacteria bacterium]
MHVADSQTTILYPARNPTKRPLTAEDLWKVARVGGPVPTPDGRVVVPVTTYDLETNKGKTRLWLVPGEGGEPRPLTSEEHASTEPAVSPDGRWISFLRTRGEEKPQLHIMPLDGGEAERLTDLPLGVLDPRWFPDGTKVAFISMLLEEAPTPEGTKGLLEKRAKDPVKAHVTEDRVYRYWDRWLTEGEKPHIFVLDLATRRMTDATPQGTGWFDLMDPCGQYDISPDGTEIAFAANSSRPPHQLLRWAIYTAPASGKGPVTCLTPEGTPPKSADFWRPRYSPDGKSIYYGMQRDPYFYADKVRIVRHDRASKTHTVLTEDWDRSPAAWELAKDGTVILEAEDRGRVLLFAMPAGGGTPNPLTEQGTVSGLKIGRDGRVYFTLQTISAAPEATSIRLDGKELRKLTGFNDALLSEVALGEVREIEFAGADGNRVQMFVVLPPGFDPKRKWPLVHVIHGGPHGIAGDNFHFRWNPQAFAAPGYVVACVNFHGSTSWGQDFAAVIQGGHGDKPYTDIMRATDFLLETGYIDEKRMAATGGSYGGYLVCWIAGQTGRFACLINHAGVFDLIAEYASDITQGRHQAYGGEPWDRLDAIDRWNPARFARGFTTPMLVIHGERDYRVPHTQALAVYNIYKAKGVDARLLFFPDENHWVLKPRNSLVWNREVHAWLKRYLA